jgi:hypothetical protein
MLSQFCRYPNGNEIRVFSSTEGPYGNGQSAVQHAHQAATESRFTVSINTFQHDRD